MVNEQDVVLGVNGAGHATQLKQVSEECPDRGNNTSVPVLMGGSDNDILTPA